MNDEIVVDGLPAQICESNYGHGWFIFNAAGDESRLYLDGNGKWQHGEIRPRYWRTESAAREFALKHADPPARSEGVNGNPSWEPCPDCPQPAPQGEELIARELASDARLAQGNFLERLAAAIEILRRHRLTPAPASEGAEIERLKAELNELRPRALALQAIHDGQGNVLEGLTIWERLNTVERERDEARQALAAMLLALIDPQPNAPSGQKEV